MSHNSTVTPALPIKRYAAAVALAGFAVASSVATAPAHAASVSTTQTQHVVHRSSAASRREARAKAAAAHRRAVLASLRRRVRHALGIARAQRGKPYVYGASGPAAFDCSGLTSYAYHRAGFKLPRTAAEQAAYVHHISRAHLKIGDFVFFRDGGHVYHVGLFDGFIHGKRTVLHAPYPGAVVRREKIWTNAWFAGTLR